MTATKERATEYQREYRARVNADLERREERLRKCRESERRRRRAKMGLPEDAVLMAPKAETEEARKARKRERDKATKARSFGLTVEEYEKRVDAYWSRQRSKKFKGNEERPNRQKKQEVGDIYNPFTSYKVNGKKPGGLWMRAFKGW
jgi:hypothetical protein